MELTEAQRLVASLQRERAKTLAVEYDTGTKSLRVMAREEGCSHVAIRNAVRQGRKYLAEDGA